MQRVLYYFLSVFLVAVSAQIQWTPVIKVSTNEVSTSTNENMGHTIVASGSSVHIVWMDAINGTGIYYRRSDDQGITWGNVTRISPIPAQDDFPLISVSGSYVHLVFFRGSAQSYYKRSWDNGNSWGPDVLLNDTSFWPGVASSGPYVYASLNTQIEVGNTEVFFTRSTDNGTTWGPIQQISNATGRSEDPAITADGTSVYLAWNDNRLGTMQVFYRRSTNYGVNWGPETNLTFTSLGTYSPYVTASGALVDVACANKLMSNATYYDAYIIRSTDSGTTFNPLSDVTNTPYLSELYPETIRNASEVHFIVPTFGTSLQYYYSNDSGVTWTAPFSLVSGVTGLTTGFISTAGGIVHTTWSDSHLGHEAIFYTRTMNATSSSGPSSTTMATSSSVGGSSSSAGSGQGTTGSVSGQGTTGSVSSASGQGTTASVSSASGQGTTGSVSSASGGTSATSSSATGSVTSQATGSVTGSTSSGSGATHESTAVNIAQSWVTIMVLIVFIAMWN